MNKIKNNYLKGKQKRIFDLLISFFIIIFSSPIIGITIFLVWIQDLKNPIYFSKRIGKHEKEIIVYKIRTMIINAEKFGASSTKIKDKSYYTANK